MTIKTVPVKAADIKEGDWVCFERPELEMLGTARLVLDVTHFDHRSRLRFGFQFGEYLYTDRHDTFAKLVGG